MNEYNIKYPTVTCHNYIFDSFCTSNGKMTKKNSIGLVIAAQKPVIDWNMPGLSLGLEFGIR